MSLQVLGTDKVLRMNNFSLLTLVNSEDWQPNFNATDVMQMGDTGRVDTAMEMEYSGSIELSATGNMPGLLARTMVKRDAGTKAFEGYEYDGATSKNAYTVTQDHLREMEFDLLLHERTQQDEFDRSVWIPRCFVTGISGRADTNGMATESIQWSGYDMTGLPAPNHDVLSVSGTNTGTAVVTVPAAFDSTTHTVVYVYVNERRFRNGTSTDATTFDLTAAGTVTMTTTEGFTLNPKDNIRVLIKKNTGGTAFTSPTDFGTSARYVTSYMANIYLAPTVEGAPVESEKWLRVQSYDYSIDPRSEQLRQISLNTAGTSVYCRVPTFPVDVTANFSVYESDWADWKRMLNKSFSGVIYNSLFDFNPENIKASFAVVVKYYTKSADLLETKTFHDMRLDGQTNRANVGGRGEMTWALKGTRFTFTGVDA